MNQLRSLGLVFFFLVLFGLNLCARQTDEFVQVGERSWAWISSDESSANGALFVGDDAALAVDPGTTPAIARRFLAAVADVTDKPLRTVILTHWHPDHALGTVALAERTFELISSSKARLVMAERLANQREHIAEAMADPAAREELMNARLNLPETLIDSAQTIDLGHHRVEVLVSLPAHTTGDLFVHSLDDDVVVTGDLFFRDSCSSMGEGSVLNWIKTLDRILALQPKVIVPGHFALSESRHLERFRSLLALTVKEAQSGLDRGEDKYGKAWEHFERLVGQGYADLRQFPRYGATFKDNYGDVYDELAALPPQPGWRLGFEEAEISKSPSEDIKERLSKSPLPVTDKDGRLEFAIEGNRVVATDLWNSKEVARIAFASQPAGVAMLPGQFACAVLVPEERHIELVNTASVMAESVLETDLDPVAVAATQDGRFLFLGLGNQGLVDVFALRAKPEPRVIARLPVGGEPDALAVSEDGQELWVSCKGAASLGIVIPTEPIEEQAMWTAEDGTEVIVLGMIHSGHRTSKTWGLDQLRETIRRVQPDVVCTEIPPERWQRAWKEFALTGKVQEPRVKRFPEYVDCLFDLKVQMGFEIEPCAGWTMEMNDLRNRMIASFAKEYPEDQAAMEAEEASIAERQAADPLDEEDPRQIHSARFDARTKESLGPYDRTLNDWIGPGGWTNINAAHYALIESAIARHRGKRLLVTFGSGHKYWILEHLRAREDLTLLDPAPFLPQ